MPTSSLESSPRARHRIAAGLTCAVLVSLVPAGAAQAASSRGVPDDPGVIAEWNAIAVTTLAGDTTKASIESTLYLGFVHAAVYNAVVGIEGRYAPYRFRTRAPRGASAQAAAVAAAHKILSTYTPYARIALDTSYATSLSLIPDGGAKTRGVAYGESAADALIAQRAHDGRNAAVQFTVPPGPGVWRPTPPATLPFSAPWLGSVTPLLTRSPAQFGEPGPPPALTSARYTRDFDEVKAMGSAASTTREGDQTATAQFFAGNAIVQFNAALRNQAATRNLDIVQSARMFAAVDMTVADAIISIWHSKYLYGFWRPVTAITLAGTDGNAATTADPAWTPLLATPPYPDYVSGYSGFTGAFTRALQQTLGTRDLQLTLTSTAVPGATRSYRSAKTLNTDVVNARVWLGLHFRFADTAGLRMGQEVADWSLSRYFRPVH
ncbi:vanadium-dependent haloperoxidase [Actinoplanes sp. NPDC048791]|uniref:vanadium-dependent haloperoxidase n=1 Tax=Actinoplanes sp. NPDC048791 TaxID=3154623 RepID=UPI0033F84608